MALASVPSNGQWLSCAALKTGQVERNWKMRRITGDRASAVCGDGRSKARTCLLLEEWMASRQSLPVENSKRLMNWQNFNLLRDSVAAVTPHANGVSCWKDLKYLTRIMRSVAKPGVISAEQLASWANSCAKWWNSTWRHNFRIFGRNGFKPPGDLFEADWSPGWSETVYPAVTTFLPMVGWWKFSANIPAEAGWNYLLTGRHGFFSATGIHPHQWT